METVQEKYARIRNQIGNGYLINVRGSSALAKAIEWGDSKDGVSAYYSHSLMAFKYGNRLLCLQSMANGVVPAFLSTEIFANVDFCIIKPLCSQDIIDAAVLKAFDLAETGIPYDYMMLPKVLEERKFGIRISADKIGSICSVFAYRNYGGLLPLKCYSEAVMNESFITPQDSLRYADFDEVQIIGHTGK
jgi:hypothetical protein